jgi:hypothetical protein
VGATITGKLIFSSGFRLKIPGLEAVELVVGQGEFAFEMRAQEESIAAGDAPFSVTIKSLPIALRLKTDLLKPVRRGSTANTWEEYGKNTLGEYVDGAGNPIYPDLVATVTITVRYTWNGEPEISFLDPVTNSPVTLSISTPFMIGESGIVLEVQGAIPDLSETNSPTGIADPAWRGVKFEKFSVFFTQGLDVPEMQAGPGATPSAPELAAIQLTNFSVGTGGFSGRISGSATGLLVLPLFGMEFELASINLDFKQSALVGSEIAGIVRNFPYFETDVRLTLGLDLQGNFKIGVAANDPNRNSAGFVEWTIQDVMKIEIQSISFEYREEVFLTRLNGLLTPQFIDGACGSADSAKVQVNGLTITSEGDVSIEGGWITLPEKCYVDFNAFKIELAEIGFGKETNASTSQRWVGFSGGIELVSGLSASAKVKRLQFLWPRTDGGQGVDIKLQGIEVGYSQPGVVTFNGAVDWFEDGEKKGFAGAISVNLEFINTLVTGRLVIGEAKPAVGAPPTPRGTCTTTATTSPFKFFYIDLEANLPTGIPVFSNVALYGFLGLFAYNMEPQLCAFTTPLRWFEAHRLATNVVAGTPSPWIPAGGSLAVGLGVILGTASDDGYVINAKVALTVAVPGPVVILSGQGNVLTKRGDLKAAADPLFAALAIYDGRQKVFLLNLGLHYKKPESGDIIDLHAQAEAYFNLNDPSDWHLWLGRKTPESERIRARIISLFTASAYYMLDPSQLAFGAKAGYDSKPKFKFGPLKASIVATFSHDVALSWRPQHAWGEARLDGEASLKAFGFGVSLGAHARLTAETPTPYMIDGEFKVKLKLPWPLPDPSGTVRLHWEKQRPKEPIDQHVTEVGLEASKSTAAVRAEPARGVTVASGHSIPLSTLCSPWESLPVMPDLDEDLNGNGTLDTGEDADNDGVLDVTPTPLCTARPLIPVDYRPVVAFARNTNQATPTAVDQARLVGNVGTYQDNVGGATFRYNLTSLRLWATKKSGTTATFTEVLPKVYGAWPALLGDPMQPGALYVKLWSKNPFSIYEPNTYIFSGTTDTTFTDWIARTYGDYPCPGIDTSKVGEGYTGSGGSANYAAAAAAYGKRCPDPNILTHEDLILPPYHVFALASESQAAATGGGTPKSYRDVAYFHTAGAPLNLDPYVYLSVPEDIGALHYRSYDVGLRFNETYMDLLYKDPGSIEELRYKDPAQKFFLEVLDAEEQPIRDGQGNLLTITTRWEQAPDHIRNRTDEEWLDLLQAQGIPINPSGMPRDDAVYARPNWLGGLGPSQRYMVRAWIEDDRLQTDPRLTDEIWLRANEVRRHLNNRVLLHEFSLVTSAYMSFNDLGSSYEGSWWPLPVAAFSAGVVYPLASAAANRTAPPGAMVTNAHAGYVARYLAHAAASLGPDDVGPGVLEAWLARVPGYNDRTYELTAPERSAILAAWKAERAAFDSLDKYLGLERSRQPLPTQVELNVLQTGGGGPGGFLLELPEPVEWARVRVTLEGPASAGASPSTLSSAVIVNRQRTRAFIFRMSGGAVTPLVDGTYRLKLEFFRNIGSRNPRLYAPDGLDVETVTLTADLPSGFFPAELP